MNEHDNIKLKARGEQAKRILEDEIFLESFKAVREGYIQTLINSDVDDKELRETNHKLIYALDAVAIHLKKVIGSGDIAEFNLKEINRNKKKVK